MGNSRCPGRMQPTRLAARVRTGSRLKAMAAAMLGMSISRTIIQEFDQFKTLIFDGGRTSQLLRRLCASLKMLEDPDGLLRLDLPYLQIDDLIYRYLALLLLPQGVLLPPAPSSPGEHRDRIFEDLLEWIRANLGASLNLTELEHRSGYSRRTLQNTFRFRFGCGPIQWVRRQRLEPARLVLLDPPSPTTRSPASPAASVSTA